MATDQAPFRARLKRYPGPAGWTFARVPKKYGTLLAVPKRLRGGKEHGDLVEVTLEFR